MSSEEKVLSRRTFLKGAAAGTVAVAGAAALAGCGSTGGSELPKKWDKEADVVVVGYGGAGAAATIEAAKAGAKVIVLEKLPTDGGSSAICGGVVYCGGGTSLQKACGFEDTRDNMYNYLLAAAGDGADPEMVGVFCDKSVELFDWLVGLGVPFKPSFIDGKWPTPYTDDGLYWSGNEERPEYAAVAKPVPRGHHAQAPGNAAIAWWPPIQAAVKATGAEVLYEAPATRLVVNDEGRVVGVVAQVEGVETFIKANKAVILTAGGFQVNKEMLAQHCPYLLPCYPMGPGGDEGQGIKMGQLAGGDVRMMGYAFSYRATYMFAPGLVRGILVNAKGHRFIAEDSYGSFVGYAVLNQSPTTYLIADDTMAKEIPAAVQDYLQVTAQGNTIAELAAGLGIEPEVLEGTVERYNKYATEGADREWLKDPKYMVPLATPPFYAYYYGELGCSVFTTGGLRVDTKTRVLCPAGDVIPGLYAAGRNAFHVTAQVYPASGVSMSEVFTFGRIAGQEAAALEPWGK